MYISNLLIKIIYYEIFLRKHMVKLILYKKA